MTFKQTNLGHESPAKKAVLSKVYQALDLYSLIGGKVERELNLEEQVAASVAKEREKIEAAQHQIEESKNQLLEMMALMKSTLEHFSVEKEKYWQDVQKEMGEIVLLLVNRIIETEVKTNPEIIEKCLAALMDQYRQGDKVRLSLNTEDLQVMELIDSKILSEIKSAKGIELVAADELNRGNARLDTSTLRMDAGVGKRMEFVWNEMSAMMPAPIKLKEEVAGEKGSES